MSARQHRWYVQGHNVVLIEAACVMLTLYLEIDRLSVFLPDMNLLITQVIYLNDCTNVKASFTMPHTVLQM